MVHENYFAMPAELKFQYGIDEGEYIEQIFRYVLEHKLPQGKRLVAIEHKVGAPTREEIQQNIDAVRAILLLREWGDEAAVAPFLFCLEVLDELDPHQREIGLAIDRRFFEEPGVLNRVLLCGDKFSSGIQMAVGWANEYGIPVSGDSPLMQAALEDYLASNGGIGS